MAELGELEGKLRDVGEKLQSPPDDVDALLKLIHEAEIYILKVEQAPSESMISAITPAMKALIKKELLDNSSYEVKLSVVSCISEITRITAPDTPYDDDVMKDVFSIMVGSFEKLDDMENPLFRRIVAILETVAKVRLCVVMLDLECEDLILQMFHNFFTTVKPNHPENVTNCMTTIMILVIEEDDEVEIPIAECLLKHAKSELKETSAASFELAEKVIGACSEKLKPVFLQLLKGTSLNEYDNIIATICEDSSDVKEDMDADPSGKDVVDDGKLSERTISDELPQEPAKLEQDVTQTTAIGSGATPVDNGTESAAANPKELSNPNSEKKDGVKQSAKVANGASAETSERVDGSPAMVKSKRGRPPGLKSLEKKAAGKKVLGLKKVEETTDSTGKLSKQSSKDDSKSSTRKASGAGSSKKQQKISLKQKDETDAKEDTAKDLSLKEMVSPKSVSKGSAKTKGSQGQDNNGSKRKRSQEDEQETPRSRKNKGLDASLVGARIQVWWPDDKKFYKGIVDSFDTASKRHKIAYDDGDVEVLLLRDEKWEFVSEEQDKTPDVASEISPKPRGRGRKGRGSSVQLKEGNAETPKSGGGDLPKKRGRPKGSSNGTPKSNISATSSKSKGKAARKDDNETPKVGSDLKKEAEEGSEDKATKSTEKTKDDLPEDGSNKSASKPKEASSGGKDLKDESKPSEGRAKPGRKPKVAAAVVAGEESKANVSDEKEKQKEAEGEAAAEVEQGGSAGGASTGGKKRRRKA
uniref:Tudor domain-containing protein n=1 Tax=Oryza barthii TaxID=65489 RepID=A0A0D3F7J4_9ORYZ